MDTKTALRRRDRAIVQLRDLFSVAAMCGMASSELAQRTLDIKCTTLAKCPQWVIGYFNGYRQALQDAAYRDSLMFGGYINGVFYSTHRNRDDYYEKHGISAREYADEGKVTQRGHYWATTKTPKPFFIG